MIKHVPRHRWLYYPAQRKAEALLLKCWDSEASTAVLWSLSALMT